MGGRWSSSMMDAELSCVASGSTTMGRTGRRPGEASRSGRVLPRRPTRSSRPPGWRRRCRDVSVRSGAESPADRTRGHALPGRALWRSPVPRRSGGGSTPPRSRASPSGCQRPLRPSRRPEDRSTTAELVQPRSSRCPMKMAICRHADARSVGPPTYRMTSGSAISAAYSSRSSSRQRRSSSRFVVSSVTEPA